MVYYEKDKYDFIRFELSTTKYKKYNAVLKNRETNKIVRLNFGDKRYPQYRDRTGLDIWTHIDHNDKQRRAAYRKRHIGFIKDGYYSPGYFSYNFLW